LGADLAASGWRTVAASVTGSSHREAGEPCADVSVTRIVRFEAGGELLVAIVSDGAGSSPRGAEGARVACASLLDVAGGWASRRRALRELDDETVRGWVEHVRDRVAGAALVELCQPGDFATTLLAALVDESSALFLQIGDGAIVYRQRDRGYAPALWPQQGEYANTTWFVTDPRAGDIVEVARAACVHELALLSDGLQALALRLSAREAHGPFFEPMFRRLRASRDDERDQLEAELRSFLDGPVVNARTDDDKTLVLATRLPGES
jgi:hypothetical protein